MSPVNVPAIGAYIREQREQARISLRQLAQATGVSNPYLSQIERGLRKPSADILQQLAKGLRISAEALYVQAGFLEDRPAGQGVREAVLTDPELTERQKQMLIEIYDSFRNESAPDDAEDAEDGEGTEPGGAGIDPAALAWPELPESPAEAVLEESAREQAALVQAVAEQAVAEQAVAEQAAAEQAAAEQAAAEQAAAEQAAAEQAAAEQAAAEQAAQETAGRASVTAAHDAPKRATARSAAAAHGAPKRAKARAAASERATARAAARAAQPEPDTDSPNGSRAGRVRPEHGPQPIA